MNSTDELTRAKAAAFRLLKFQARTEKELHQRLKQKKFTNTAIRAAIQSLKDLHYLDDRQFTKNWLNAHLTKPFGLKRISYELKIKGISGKIIEEELAHLKEGCSEETAVLSLIKKQLEKIKKLEPRQIKPRLFRYLSQRGFEVETIEKALGQLNIDNDDNQKAFGQ